MLKFDRFLEVVGWGAGGPKCLGAVAPHGFTSGFWPVGGVPPYIVGGMSMGVSCRPVPPFWDTCDMRFISVFIDQSPPRAIYFSRSF